MPAGTLLERVGALEGTLSASHQAVASFLLQSGHKGAFLTAAEIATAVGTSESTVVRFARILGFRGFPELQAFLREGLLQTLSPVERLERGGRPATTSQLAERLLESETANLRAAVENVDAKALEQLVQAIVGARTCFIVGLRSSRSPATLLGHYLSKIVRNVALIATSDNLLEQLSWIEEGDVLIAYSFPRYSKPTIDALRIAKSKGAQTGTITDSIAAPSAQIADHVLVSPAASSFYGNSFVGTIALTNLLLAACGQSHPELIRSNLQRVEEAASMSERFVRLT